MLEPIYTALILGLVGACFLTLYVFNRLGKGHPVKHLFKEFNRKIWMTVCLGIIFFGLYVFSVFLGSFLIKEWGAASFFFAYRHPIILLYTGLGIFACTSLCIYLVRMFIKYFYLTRGKDN